MRADIRRRLGLAVALCACVGTSLIWVNAQQANGGPVAIDPDDIGGVVTSSKGPEAGVWVIAETTSLPTKFARIVVTDNQGRYVLPDLPRGNYQVWVRGYGLVDSSRQSAKPGQQLNLTAQLAPSPAAAAQYYPPAYWLAMMDKPGASGGCQMACHAIGNKATREIPASILKKSASSLDAWDLRTSSGPEGGPMGFAFKRLGPERKLFADWTDRIAKGEIPTQVPKRPAGLERNLVVTVWDWGTKYDGRTDAVASDVRDPTLNQNGPVYMVARSDDILATLDPTENQASSIKVPSPAPEKYTKTPWSPYWGDEPVWKRRAEPRSVAIDAQGRVWLSAIVRERPGQPPFCYSETNKFARNFPMKAAPLGVPRQAQLYDPRTRQFTNIPDVCTTLDHNGFGPGEVLYFGAADVLFWIDTPTFLKTKDAEAAQGWCPAVVDTNGDGKITEWTEPDAPIDPTKDHRVKIGCYAVAVDPNDRNGVAWCGDDLRLTRIERGPSPPQSCKAEVYKPPVEVQGPGHASVDGQGVVWTNWRGSQHFTSFDRRKCKVTNGPKAATGDGCPEGWTVYRREGPTYPGTNILADYTYLSQVDRHDALGLGKDVPMYGNINDDSIVALVPQTKQFVTLRVPYPMGFFSRSANGRIDDPRAGWKGKGLWSSYSTYIPWGVEGVGTEGDGSKAVKFQMRPSPLAK